MKPSRAGIGGQGFGASGTGLHGSAPRSSSPQPPNPDPCPSCPFCELGNRELVAENALAAAFRDGFPVNPGHTLIVPRRHVATWFDATREEQLAILELADQVKAQLDAEFQPAGYNLGLNAGEAAGQTVPHLHLHLIPRFKGDVDDPTGGVRFVIPARGNYRRPGFIPNTGGASLLAEPSDRKGRE
jgi:diadenosine tetraphosphate (Ap4A) HIT family hydrolase